MRLLRRFRLIGLIGMLLIVLTMSVQVQSEGTASTDLTAFQGDYVMTESYKFDESLLPFNQTEDISEMTSEMTDEELQSLVDQIYEETFIDPEVAFTWSDEPELSNLFILTVKNDFIIQRNLMLPTEMYSMSGMFINQHQAYNGRTLQFQRLESYLAYDQADDQRSFFVFDEEAIYQVSLTMHGIYKYEPIKQVAMARDLSIPPVELPTDESRSLAVYEVDTADFEAVDYANIIDEAAMENMNLISLSGIILDYASFADYAEAKVATHPNGTDDVVLLQFYYFPTEPLNEGDAVKVYGQFVGPKSSVSGDETHPAVIVQKLENQ